tara:strand:- start:1166 stop:1792 length:627 start_codon:yes stop_codon:yes gene_type:complete
MKKILWIVLLFFFLNVKAYTDNITDFNIENISIGDSALDYFNEPQIVNSELDWFNYSYKEYSTSLLPGKGIYDWFKLTYKSNDDYFKILGIVGIIVKNKYDSKECNNQLDTAALEISRIFENTQQAKKQMFNIVYDSSKIFQETNSKGKSTATSILFDFNNGGEIILSCYDMEKKVNEIDSPIKDINQFDTFRVDARSKVLVNYLKKD